jgi:hypothetical protein
VKMAENDVKMAENAEFISRVHQNSTELSSYGAKVFGT